MTGSRGHAPERAPFGAVLAGGESSRFGSPKALARVGGVRIVDRVVHALSRVTPALVLSANEPALFADLGLPTYPDVREGLGPLGGIYTTLLQARESGRPGILAVACDMPFPSVELLALLAWEAFRYSPPPAPGRAGDPDADAASHGDAPPDIVVPESRGRRGLEPLFAAYSTACIPAIEAALAGGDRRMIGFHGRVQTRTIPLPAVAAVCDPAVAFLNVNTRADRERADAIAAGRSEG